MTLNYTYIPGFFVQDDPNANATAIGPLPPRFGLLDDQPGHWARFKEKIDELNHGRERGSVKVFFLGRHGEGFHNVAEAKYGTPAWDSYWSELDGDGVLVWGPDAQLTDLGVQQAQSVHQAWVNEIPSGVPIPSLFYSSPLSRAAKTCEITWSDIIIPNTNTSSGGTGNTAEKNARHFLEHEKVMVVENCREVYGIHTCDQRHNKTYIEEHFPEFVIEHGFTEQDELWTTTRETDAHVALRAKTVLDQIWENHAEATFVSITSHGGFIGGFLTVVGRGSYPLSTGGVIVLVVKASEI